MKKFLLVILLAVFALAGMAQTDRQYIRSGNRFYRQQNFVKAESEYRKSLSVNPGNPLALYNLGCALLMQKKDSAAIRQFEAASRVETAPLRKAKIYHNIGFICQSRKLYGDAVNAYKESLRNNPADNETRYNLALCKRLDKQNKNRQNQQKNQQNKDKNKEKKDKQNQQNKENNQDKQQKQQQQQEKMSRDNAEQLLNAAMQDEQATQRRVKDAMRNSRSRKLEKNW